MKTNVQPRSAGRGSNSRSAMSSPLQYMSERQTEAYLLSRDTIRRIQRTSSLIEAAADAWPAPSRGPQARPTSH